MAGVGEGAEVGRLVGSSGGCGDDVIDVGCAAVAGWCVPVPVGVSGPVASPGGAWGWWGGEAGALSVGFA